jgi:hypothetical protein
MQRLVERRKSSGGGSLLASYEYNTSGGDKGLQAARVGRLARGGIQLLVDELNQIARQCRSI